MIKVIFSLLLLTILTGCSSYDYSNYYLVSEEEQKSVPVKHVDLQDLIDRNKTCELSEKRSDSLIMSSTVQSSEVNIGIGSKLMFPMDGVNSYDESNDGKKIGLQIKSYANQDIKAADHGVIIYSGKGVRGYRNLVIIKHAGNLMTTYANSSYIKVKEGDIVKKGQIIGVIEPDDFGDGVLHFGVRLNGKCVDPNIYLSKN